MVSPGVIVTLARRLSSLPGRAPNKSRVRATRTFRSPWNGDSLGARPEC